MIITLATVVVMAKTLASDPKQTVDGLTKSAALSNESTQNQSEGAALAKLNPAASCWQVVAYDGNKEPQYTASSFAVSEYLLATNAHVVQAFADVVRKRGHVRAFQSETGADFEIADMWIHPGYDPDEDGFSPDVGLLAVFGSLPSTLTLADDRTLDDLSVPANLILYGFPGDISVAFEQDALRNRTLRPNVTCLPGHVTSIRYTPRFWMADSGAHWVIQHDMSVTGGTSGSPILNPDGAVVAINMGITFDEHGQNGFAIGSNVLEGLLSMVRLGVLPSVDTVSVRDVGYDDEPAPEPALIRLLDDTAEAVGGWPIASIVCIGIVSLTFLQIARIRAKPQKRLTEAMSELVDVLGHRVVTIEPEKSRSELGDLSNAKPE